MNDSCRGVNSPAEVSLDYTEQWPATPQRQVDQTSPIQHWAVSKGEGSFLQLHWRIKVYTVYTTLWYIWRMHDNPPKELEIAVPLIQEGRIVKKYTDQTH